MATRITINYVPRGIRDASLFAKPIRRGRCNNISRSDSSLTDSNAEAVTKDKNAALAKPIATMSEPRSMNTRNIEPYTAMGKLDQRFLPSASLFNNATSHASIAA